MMRMKAESTLNYNETLKVKNCGASSMAWFKANSVASLDKKILIIIIKGKLADKTGSSLF